MTSDGPGDPLDSEDPRFDVELARFVDGRPDPSSNTCPPGNPPLDVLKLLEAQEQLDQLYEPPAAPRRPARRGATRASA